jgi:hypothetical protein
MSSNQQYAIGLTIAAVVIFVSAFMPWGTVRNAQLNLPNVRFTGQIPPNEFGPSMNPAMFNGGFPGVTFDITMTGWNGMLTLGGLRIPNWLVVLAAAAVAALEWLAVNRVWTAPIALLFAIAGYAALHAVALGAVLGFGGGSVDFGLMIAVLASIGMLVVLGQEVRRPRMDRAS